MKQPAKLNQLQATAICGNDISSSCLYVSALSIGYAGQYAWITLLMVAVVLFFFRKIYGEVVGALPLNGGAYNVLLNTTSKGNASIAASLTILSYMATAVLSATEAMHYFHSIFTQTPVLYATIALLAFFLLLTIMGITESSLVAVIIFIVHLVSLTTLVLVSIFFLITGGFDNLAINFKTPVHGSVLTALFFGFSAAMLGISGFESSANFVEEQERGVFPKTLRNMWIVVSIFNPLLAFLAIAVLPLAEVGEHKETLLSHIGNKTGGYWLATLISIDAVLVLSGAVLTSFVGVSGLIKRMTLDRVWPQFLLKENRRGSNHYILLSFFILCISILFITGGKLGPLAGVYTISFLAVMAFFAIGNMLLKIKRARLPRPVYASGFTVFAALTGVLAALYGNIKLHPEYLVVFLQYFVPSILVIYALLNRNWIFQFLLMFLKSFLEDIRKLALLVHLTIRQRIMAMQSQVFVFFSKGDDLATLNKVFMYVQENEITSKLRIVTVADREKPVSESFMRDFEVLDRAYPEIDAEYITVTGHFGPEIIEKLSKEWRIPKNFMFISSPGDRFPYKISELGGVRLIL